MFISFGFCFCCFLCLFRYTLWVMILGFHSNFPLHLSLPPISSMCSATHRPLLGFFSRPHCDKLSTLPSNFGFRQAHDQLFFLAAVIHLVCFYVVYFPIILVAFSFWCNLCLVFIFACNNAWSFLARSAHLMPFGFVALVQTFGLWM
jgi:hypothetical protein